LSAEFPENAVICVRQWRVQVTTLLQTPRLVTLLAPHPSRHAWSVVA